MKYSPTITDTNTQYILDHEFKEDNHTLNRFKKPQSSLETLEIVKKEQTSPMSSPGISDTAEDDHQLKARIRHGFDLHLLKTAPQCSNRSDRGIHHYKTELNPSKVAEFSENDTNFDPSKTIGFSADILQGLDMTINSVPKWKDGNIKQCINRNLINNKTSAPVQELNDQVQKDENYFMSQQNTHVKLKQELDKFQHSSVAENINILSEEESSVDNDYSLDSCDDGDDVSDTELDDLPRSNRTFEVNYNIQNKMDSKSQEKTHNNFPVFKHAKYSMEKDSNERTPKRTSGLNDKHNINEQPMTLTLDEPFLKRRKLSQKHAFEDVFKLSQKHSFEDVYEFPSDETSKSSMEDFSYETFDKNVLHKRRASEPFQRTCKVLSHHLSVPGSRVLSDGVSVPSRRILSDGVSVPGSRFLSDGVSVPGSRLLSDGVSVPGSRLLSDGVSVPGITRRKKLVHNVYRDEPPCVHENQGLHKSQVGANIFKQEICDTTQANEQTFFHHVTIDDDVVDDDVVDNDDVVDDDVDVVDDRILKNTCLHDKCFTENKEVDKSDHDIVNYKNKEHVLRVHKTSDNVGPIDFSIGSLNEPLSKKYDDSVRNALKDKNNKHIRHSLQHKEASTYGFTKDVSVVAVDNSKTGLLDVKYNVVNGCTVICRTSAMRDTDMLSDGKCSHKSQSDGTFISGTRCFSNVTMNLEEDESGAEKDRLKVKSALSGLQNDRLKVISALSGTQKDRMKVMSGQFCNNIAQLKGIAVNETSVTHAHVGGRKDNRSSMDETCDGYSVEPSDICELTQSRRVSNDDELDVNKDLDTEHVDESGSINDFPDFISGMCHPERNVKVSSTISVIRDTEKGMDSANLLILDCDRHLKPNIICHGASNKTDTEPYKTVRDSDVNLNTLKRVLSNEINLCPSKSVKRGCHTDDIFSGNLMLNVDSTEQHINAASKFQSPASQISSKEPADSLKEYLETVKHEFLPNFNNDRNTPFTTLGHLSVPMATVEYGSEMSEYPIGSSTSSCASVSESSSVFDSSNKLNDDVDESSQNKPKFEDDEGEHGHQGNWNETLKSFILQNLESEHVSRLDTHQVDVCEPERRPSLEAMLEEKLAEQYLHRNLDLLRNKTATVSGLSHRKRDLYDIFKDSENEESFFRQVVGMEAIKDLRTERVKDLNNKITGSLPGHCARTEKEPVHSYKDESILTDPMKVDRTDHFDFVGSDYYRTDNVHVYGNSDAPVNDSIINAEAVNTMQDGMSTDAQLPSNSYTKFTAASSHNEPRGDEKRSMNVSQIVFPSTSNSCINSSILPVQGLSHLYDLGEHGNHGILQTHVQPRPAHTGSNTKGQYSPYSDLFEKGHHSKTYLKSKGDNNETISEYEDADFLLNLVKGESDI